MKKASLISSIGGSALGGKNRLGFAWIPVILLITFGSAAVIGGSVAYNDWQVGKEAQQHAVSADDKQVLRDELNQFFNHYRQSCFSKVASIGNRQAYQTALDQVNMAYNPKRKMDAGAQYLKGALFLQRPVKDYDLKNEVTRANFQTTIWHELTHHLEVKNNDRMSWHNVFDPRRELVAQRNERHAEYMERVISILQQLMRIESRVKKKELTGEQVKGQLAALKQQFSDGSANTFEAVPSDLDQLAKYTGFQVDLNKIFELYQKGTCLKFPEGSFDKATSHGGEQADDSQKYVVFEGTNATVGIVIATKKTYETEEPASSYPGGGLDPNYILEKKLLSGDQTFDTFEAAQKWICDQFTEVWYAPLGIGWTAKYQGRDVFLANTSCGK